MLITPKYARLVPTVQVGARIPWGVTLAKNCGRFAGRAIAVGIASPRYSGIAGLAAAAIILGGFAWLLALAIGCAALALWIYRHPDQFIQGAYGAWRSFSLYRGHPYMWAKGKGWGTKLRRCDATKNDVPVPLLLGVQSTMRRVRRPVSISLGKFFAFDFTVLWPEPVLDKLLVRIPEGLDPTAFQDYRAELLAWAWRARSVRVFDPDPKHQTVELWNLINDPLTEPVEPFTKPAEAFPKGGWELARVEDNTTWRLDVADGAAHMFIGGVSGAGKGSVIGALLDAGETAREQGLAEFWGVDPQASELGMSRHLFAPGRLVFTQQEAADLLEEAVAEMDRRTRGIFGITRKHTPSSAAKHIELIVDEGLDLLDKSDRKLYRRIDAALRQLLRKGRKARIRVTFISQRAELDTVDIRKDFNVFVALEQTLETDVDMILGRGALKAGAKAHEIKLPGEAYIRTVKGIIRARFPYYPDEHLQELPPAPGNENPEALATVPDDDDMGFA